MYPIGCLRAWRIGAGSVAMLLMAACRSPAAPTTYYPGTALVYGVVRDTANRPVRGVYIVGQVFSADCVTRMSTDMSFVNPVTDDAGRYRLLMQLPTAAVRCVRLLAATTPRADSVVAQLPNVSFRLSNSDSIRVDVRLP